MNKTLTVALALAAGLLGSVIGRYIAPPSAYAQEKAAVAKEIRAQSFTLVDAFDHTAGTFTYEPLNAPRVMSHPPLPENLAPPDRLLPGRVVLRDASGRVIWSAGANSLIRPVSER
jgi:hypothetical protein